MGIFNGMELCSAMARGSPFRIHLYKSYAHFQELTAAGLTLGFWDTGIHLAIWITIFWVLIACVNLAGVRVYGECEMVFAFLKISAIIMFVIAGIVVDCGGGPNGHVLGLKYWKDPGIDY